MTEETPTGPSGPKVWLLALTAVVGAAIALLFDRALSPRAEAPPPAAPAAAPAPPPPPPVEAPALVDPGQARIVVAQTLEGLGVPKSGIAHGLYPLRGPGRALEATLPLVSFGCPASMQCPALLEMLAQKARGVGLELVGAKAGDSAGRPYYRALARGGHPALAVRAYPPGPRLTVVINDVGREPALLDPLLALPEHITFAVLATAPHASEVAKRLAEKGREVIAHLPMEPAPPERADGPNHLRTDVEPSALMGAVEALLERVPGAVGANAHQGSRLTTSRPHMAAVLEVLRRKALFFLDDRSSPASVAEATAGALGVRTATRSHYLDREDGPPDPALRAIEAALVLDGSAIVVAPADPEVLLALRPWLARLGERKINLLRVSEIVR